jgi:hypothetical protein
MTVLIFLFTADPQNIFLEIKSTATNPKDKFCFRVGLAYLSMIACFTGHGEERGIHRACLRIPPIGGGCVRMAFWSVGDDRNLDSGRSVSGRVSGA